MEEAASVDLRGASADCRPFKGKDFSSSCGAERSQGLPHPQESKGYLK